MARVCPLFSSSNGNSTFVGNAESGILIDAGVSYRKLVNGMTQCGISPEAIKAIFITHEHSDHIAGLSVFTKKFDIPVYSQQKTLNSLLAKGYINSSKVYAVDGQSVCVDDAEIEISAFETPHDTEQSCGYKIKTSDDKSIAICTDLGHITPVVEENLMGSDLVLLEANYDLQMLRNGHYPYYLKKRIMSSNGHLSNLDSASMIKKLLSSGTTRVVLGHLSQENNTPQVAENTVSRELKDFVRGRDYLLGVAPVETNGMVIAL